VFLIFVYLRSECSVQESSETLRLSKKKSQEKKTTEDELGYKYETSAEDTAELPGRLYGVFHQTDPSEPMAPAHHALTHFSIAHSSGSLLSMGNRISNSAFGRASRGFSLLPCSV
jgi:hypothetical protein